MKRVFVFVCLALAGCAGIEPGNPNSPAAVRMREALAAADRTLRQVAGEVADGVGEFGQAYSEAYAAQAPKRLERKLDDIDWELYRLRQGF